MLKFKKLLESVRVRLTPPENYLRGWFAADAEGKREAYNKTKQPMGAGQASACGYVTPTGRNGEWPNCNLRVTNKAGTTY